MNRSLGYLLSALPLVVSSLAVAKDLPHRNAFAEAPAARTVVRPVLPRTVPPAVVTSIDKKRGTPTFLWADRVNNPLPTSSIPEEAAREHLTRHAPRYGLTPQSMASATVVHVHDIGRGGIVVTLRQSINGVELFQHDTKVLMDRDLRLVAITGSLRPDAVPSPKHGAFTLPDSQAIAVALNDLFGVDATSSDLLFGGDSAGGYHRYDVAAPGASSALGIQLREPSRVKPVYFAMPDRLVAAYFLEVAGREVGSEKDDVYSYVVAADDGRILYRSNLTHKAKFNYRVFADTTGDLRPHDGPLLDYTPYPAATPNGSYPGLSMSSLIAIDGFNKFNDPWLPDTATQSQGNNIDAYTDDANPDGFSKNDVRAHTTSANTFDLTYDFTKGPQSSIDQRMASVTSLFYITNWLHDWWYDSGFDEKDSNAQMSNLGRGGIEGDPLFAEAQSGAPIQRNNSDMDVEADGTSPRMHMFVWDGKGTGSLTLGMDPPITNFGQADFGAPNFDLTAQVVQVNDGTAPTDDLCEAIVNDITGKIALIQRGTCTFEAKAQSALAAGAVGVIIYDNTTSTAAPSIAIGMPANTVALPIQTITQAAGQALIASLAAGPVTAHMTQTSAPDIDGTLDNSIVAHEWGHYLHLRHVNCGSNMCLAQSEGWADFDALMMEIRDGDDYDGAYAVAQYATKAFPGDPGYFGIRRVPYSDDFAKDPLTFKDITTGQDLPTSAPIQLDGSDNAEAHAAGEIWASMLIGAYTSLLKTPTYTYDQAHRAMSDYVVLGMRAAPTDPTYTEQRDAVLAGAAATSPADFASMAAAFAKRGAGTCAVSPDRESTDFMGVVEDFSVHAAGSIVSVAIDDSVKSCDSDGHLDAGESGKLTVVVSNDGTASLDGATATVTTTTPGLTFPNGATLTYPSIAIHSTGTATIDVALDNTVTAPENASITVTLVAMTCGTPTPTLATPYINYDDEATGSTVDNVEAAETTWTLSGDMSDQIWSRTSPNPPNHVWSAVDFGSVSDTSLVSPPLTVSATDKLVMTFKQSYQFEDTQGVTFDGAVIEVSTDAGKTWADISKYGDPGYDGSIGDPQMASMNPLQGRMGYVNQNKSYPMMDTTTIDMGMSLAGMTVQVRFRAGSDEAQGAPGWDLDDIGFTGITNAPFAGIGANKTACATGAGGAGGAAGNGGNGGSTTMGGAGHSAGMTAQAGAGGSKAGAAGSGGAAGVTATAGASGAAGTAGGNGGPAVSPAGQDDSSGGCSCTTAPSSTPTELGLGLLGLAAAFGARRKSKRAS